MFLFPTQRGKMDSTSQIFTIRNTSKESIILSADKNTRPKKISFDWRRSRVPIVLQMERSMRKTNSSISNKDDSKLIHGFYGILAQVILIASPSFVMLIMLL